jgi:hypothetical protein
MGGLHSTDGNAGVQLANGPVRERFPLADPLLSLDSVPEADLTVKFSLPLHDEAGPDVQILALIAANRELFRKYGCPL